MEDADRKAVIATLGRYPPERFAVIDAAHFDDMGAELAGSALAGEPLYLDDMGDGPANSGPWLVSLPDWQAADRVLQLCGDRPAAVFWSWGDGQKALYRHLRRLNMVEIPADDFNEDYPAYDKVLFRHADPNVMANALSVLHEGQFALVLGAAAGLVMFAPDFGGLREAPALAHNVEQPKGMLRFEPGQIEGIEAAQVAKVSGHVRDYLKKVAPEQTASLSEAELNAHVVRSMRESVSYGVTGEASHCRWAYLQLLTRGRLSKEDSVRVLMTSHAPQYSADARVKMLMRHSIAHVWRNG